jgi:hypothetical protein
MLKFTNPRLLFAALAFAGALASGCQKNANQPVQNAAGNQTASVTKLKIQAVSLTQGFEVGSTSPKTAYDVSPTGSSSGDNVTLSGNSWNLYDALIGNLRAI